MPDVIFLMFLSTSLKKKINSDPKVESLLAILSHLEEGERAKFQFSIPLQITFKSACFSTISTPVHLIKNDRCSTSGENKVQFTGHVAVVETSDCRSEVTESLK